MTKEELEKEAEEYAQKLGVKDFIAKPKEIVAYFGYLAGAEPREKQIKIDAEQIRALQKQNGKLTDKVRELEDRLCNVANNLLDSWCRNEEDYCPHLAKLEKENAELNEKVNILDNCDRLGDVITEAYKEQLTKAKEIIKKYYNYNPSCKYFYEDIDKEAEQFLKDCEVKK